MDIVTAVFYFILKFVNFEIKRQENFLKDYIKIFVSFTSQFHNLIKKAFHFENSIMT